MGEGKSCSKCGKYKLFNHFDKQTKSPDGHRSSCKLCNKPIKKKHYQDNKNSYKQAYKEFMERNPNYQINYRKKKPN